MSSAMGSYKLDPDWGRDIQSLPDQQFIRRNLTSGTGIVFNIYLLVKGYSGDIVHTRK